VSDKKEEGEEMNRTTVRIAWRNLWRHPQRTFLMITMVAFGSWVILVMWGITDGFFSSMIRAQVAQNQGSFQLRAVGYADDPIPKNRLTPEEITAVKAALNGLRICAATTRLESLGMLRSAYGMDGVAIRGVDPVKEQMVTDLQEHLTAGHYLANHGEILLSSETAERLDVRLGERVVLLAHGENGTASQAFIAVGLFSSALADLNRTVLVPIDDARELTGWDGATAIAVSVPPGVSTPRIVAQARERVETGIEVADYYDLNPLARTIIQGSVIKMIPFVIMVSLLVGFGVANTTFYSVLERTRELGVMTALGMSRRQLARMVLLESAFVSAIGFVVGGGVGYGSLLYLSRVGLNFGRWMGTIGGELGMPTVIYASTSGWYWLAAFSVVVFTALTAAWYPARRVNHLEPVAAIREG
jgi:ABC-type lipoprotein release transport system permease subunit